MSAGHSSLPRPGTYRTRRSRNLLLGVTSGLGARLIAMLAPLVTLPLLLDALGTTLFALYATSLSLTAVAGFADLGLGNGLLSRVATLTAQGHNEEARRVVGAAYGLLATSATFVLVIGWGVLLLLAGRAKPESPLALPEAVTVVGVVLTVFAIALPLTVGTRVRYARQQAWVSNAWAVGGAALSVALTVLAVQVGSDPAIVVLAALVGPPLAAAADNAMCFVGPGRRLRPLAVPMRGPESRDLLRIGLGFLLLSVLASVSLNLDNVVVAHALGLDAVTPFTVAVRLFSVLNLVVTLVALPLWPANAEALARGDRTWVAGTARRVGLLSVMGVALGSAVLLAARDSLLRVWLGEEVVALPLGLGLALGAWALLLAVAAPMFAVMNSVGRLAPQYVGWAAYLVLSVPAKIALAHSMGSVGVPLAGCLVYAVTLLPAAALGCRAVLRQSAAPFSERGVAPRAS